MKLITNIFTGNFTWSKLMYCYKHYFNYFTCLCSYLSHSDALYQPTSSDVHFHSSSPSSHHHGWFQVKTPGINVVYKRISSLQSIYLVMVFFVFVSFFPLNFFLVLHIFSVAIFDENLFVAPPIHNMMNTVFNQKSLFTLILVPVHITQTLELGLKVPKINREDIFLLLFNSVLKSLMYSKIANHKAL